MSESIEELNNFKLIYDSNIKKLKLKDNKGYNFIIPFEERKIGKDNNEINSNTLKKQLKDIAQIVQNIQNTGKIGPRGPEGKKGPIGERGFKGDQGVPGSGLVVNYLVSHKEKLPNEIEEGSIGLIERVLDIYYYNNQKWIFIGNLKGKQGIKGDKGGVGPEGVKGDKGDKGDRFKFDFILKDEEQFNDEKEQLVVEEGDFVITSKESNLYTFENSGWSYITKLKGEKGDKGEMGDGLKIDFFCNEEKDLLNYKNLNYSYALAKDKMELFYNNNEVWEFIGTIKGDKGDLGDKGDKGERGLRGDRGERGDKGVRGPKGDNGDQGEKGDGINIDYFFDTFKDILSTKILAKKNEVCLILENKELRYWDDEWKLIGPINLSIKHTIQDLTYIFGAKLSNVIDKDSYEDIDSRHLKFINWESSNQDVDWLDLRGNKIFLKPNSKYLIKYNICWSVDNSRNMKNILKDGILIFSYLGNEFVSGSIKYEKGFPFVNSFQHNFLVNTLESGELKFFIKILEDNYGETNIHSESSFLEIKKI